MPKIDLSITIISIIAVCALLSPIITTIINNHYQLKVKKLELNQLEYENRVGYKRKVFEHFLQYAGQCAQNSNVEALKEYGKYYFLAYMYAPKHIQERLSKADHLISVPDYQNAIKELEALSIELNEFLQAL